MNSLKVPGELVAAFEDLILDTKAIEAKYSHFVAAIHNEQKAVAVKARELWKETRSVMNLSPHSEYNYVDGELIPVERVLNAPDVNPSAAPVKIGL